MHDPTPASRSTPNDGPALVPRFSPGQSALGSPSADARGSPRTTHTPSNIIQPWGPSNQPTTCAHLHCTALHCKFEPKPRPRADITLWLSPSSHPPSCCSQPSSNNEGKESRLPPLIRCFALPQLCLHCLAASLSHFHSHSLRLLPPASYLLLYPAHPLPHLSPFPQMQFVSLPRLSSH